MTLPKPSELVHTHTITLGEGLDVSFQLSPIPGAVYQQIIDAHRDEDGKTPWETVAEPLLEASIQRVYSSVESTPQPFTINDATEIWETWPDWARWDILQAVIAYSTKGPAANPFSGSTRNENAEQ